MKKILPTILIALFAVSGLTQAAESVSKAPDLAALKKSWNESRNKYRDALKEKRDSIQKEIRQKEGFLENEGDAHARKTLLDGLRGLSSEREDLNEQIRQLNAGDVVRFATGRNKILSALTGQTAT